MRPTPDGGETESEYKKRARDATQTLRVRDHQAERKGKERIRDHRAEEEARAPRKARRAIRDDQGESMQLSPPTSASASTLAPASAPASAMVTEQLEGGARRGAAQKTKVQTEADAKSVLTTGVSG